MLSCCCIQDGSALLLVQDSVLNRGCKNVQLGTRPAYCPTDTFGKNLRAKAMLPRV